MLVGVPGSGKTTLRDRIMSEYPGTFNVVCPDDDFAYIASEKNITIKQAIDIHGREVFRQNKDKAALYAHYGQSFIWDQMNIQDRHKKLKITCMGASTFPCYNLAVVCPTPTKEEWKIRNASRPEKHIPDEDFDDMVKRFTYPNKGEGFDRILNDPHMLHVRRVIDSYFLLR